MTGTAYKRRPVPLIERIERSIEISGDGCWIWQLSTSRAGYGRIMLKGGGKMRLAQAHRVAYEVLVEPIPVGLQLDHLCRVTSCVNPDHLEPVTAAENNRRKPVQAGGPRRPGQRARKTHCKRGHLFDEANTRWMKSGSAQCRACNHLRNKARYDSSISMEVVR